MIRARRFDADGVVVLEPWEMSRFAELLEAYGRRWYPERDVTVRLGGGAFAPPWVDFHVLPGEDEEALSDELCRELSTWTGEHLDAALALTSPYDMDAFAAACLAPDGRGGTAVRDSLCPKVPLSGHPGRAPVVPGVRYLLDGREVTDVVRADPEVGEVEYVERHWSIGEVVYEPDGRPRTTVARGRVEVVGPAPSAEGDAARSCDLERCALCGGSCPPGGCYSCCVRAILPDGTVRFFKIRLGDEEWRHVGVGAHVTVLVDRWVVVEFSNDRRRVRDLFATGLRTLQAHGVAEGDWMRVRAPRDAVDKIGCRPPWLPAGAHLLPDAQAVRLADGAMIAVQDLAARVPGAFPSRSRGGGVR